MGGGGEPGENGGTPPPHPTPVSNPKLPQKPPPPPPPSTQIEKKTHQNLIDISCILSLWGPIKNSAVVGIDSLTPDCGLVRCNHHQVLNSAKLKEETNKQRNKNKHMLSFFLSVILRMQFFFLFGSC